MPQFLDVDYEGKIGAFSVGKKSGNPGLESQLRLVFFVPGFKMPEEKVIPVRVALRSRPLISRESAEGCQVRHCKTKGKVLRGEEANYLDRSSGFSRSVTETTWFSHVRTKFLPRVVLSQLLRSEKHKTTFQRFSAAGLRAVCRE